MDIRPADVEDAPTIVDELWLPFAREMADLDPYNELAEDIRQDAIEYRRDRLASDEYRLLLAESDATPLGYAAGAVQPAPPVFARGATFNVDEVYVRPDARRQGIATALLEAIEADDINRECDTITLSVNAENSAAIGLYQDHGYAINRHKMIKWRTSPPP